MWTSLLCIFGPAIVSATQYNLAKEYSGSNFFNGWNFYGNCELPFSFPPISNGSWTWSVDNLTNGDAMYVLPRLLCFWWRPDNSLLNKDLWTRRRPPLTDWHMWIHPRITLSLKSTIPQRCHLTTSVILCALIRRTNSLSGVCGSRIWCASSFLGCTGLSVLTWLSQSRTIRLLRLAGKHVPRDSSRCRGPFNNFRHGGVKLRIGLRAVRWARL